jgi:hypothetical protein
VAFTKLADEQAAQLAQRTTETLARATTAMTQHQQTLADVAEAASQNLVLAQASADAVTARLRAAQDAQIATEQAAARAKAAFLEALEAAEASKAEAAASAVQASDVVRHIRSLPKGFAAASGEARVYPSATGSPFEPAE